MEKPDLKAYVLRYSRPLAVLTILVPVLELLVLFSGTFRRAPSGALASHLLMMECIYLLLIPLAVGIAILNKELQPKAASLGVAGFSANLGMAVFGLFLWLLTNLPSKC